MSTFLGIKAAISWGSIPIHHPRNVRSVAFIMTIVRHAIYQSTLQPAPGTNKGFHLVMLDF